MHGPQSTYRLQISADFTLFEAAKRLPALADLGVDWVYLSPILVAEPGSNHGYDVIAHDRIDPARGGAEGLDALVAAARELGMGVLVDIVPNHVGVAMPEGNAWWWDVLQHGRESAHAAAFDIDWSQHDGRILLPIVGDDDWLPGSPDAEGDGRVGHLELDGSVLRYWDTALPIAPDSAREGDDANAVLARQHYRLGPWQWGDDRLNYRRFFAVTTLAAIRVERQDVFDASHVEIRRWFDEGLVDGLRVDHPDGLRDPAGYLEDLARLTGGAFVLVEKILEPGEELPVWATAGTTGYDSLGVIDRVLTDPRGAEALDALDARLRGSRVAWSELIRSTKRGIADGILRAEVLRLEREIVAWAADADARVPEGVDDAIAELLACFPVYRSYLPEGREHLGSAAEHAKRERPELAETIDWLLPVLANPATEPARRFQQTSGMVMAKGVEDTAFYRYSRLTSLNEVGGDPAMFSLEPAEFHAFMASRQATWPHAMNTLSTHDTKRGEDVRARIATIAEVPHAWEALIERFLPFAPDEDPAFVNLLLQAIVGAWPASEERLIAYMEKAAREADAITHWTRPNQEWEGELAAFVRHVLAEPASRDVEAFLTLTDAAFRSNVLSAKLLNLLAPGFPDIYQGAEGLERSLVDPDNRRPVDWDRLDALRAAAAAPIAGSADTDPAHAAPWDLEVAKVRLVREALRLRRDRPERCSGYAPLLAGGEAAEHVVAFDRGGAIAVATRLPIGLEAAGGWSDTTLDLPEGRWRELLTEREFEGGTVPVGALLDVLPVALLTRAD